MDEAQALADTAVVIAAGRVVAAGPPDTLGGREHGETTVRFILPAGASLGALPLPADLVPEQRGEFVEFHIDEPTAVLHALTSWALERGEVLAGLAVQRPTLEDVYLALTGETDSSDGADGGSPGTGAAPTVSAPAEATRPERERSS
jgi:ABC-2 type transport system ATP-binding protein